jgi:hypothetical protein
MDETPVAQRAYVVDNGKHLNRWTIEGHNGLFRFRVMSGKKQQLFQGEVEAKFKTYDKTGFSMAYFHPDDGEIPPLKIPVEKTIIQDKPYFRISWGSGWRCILGKEWTAEVEKEARTILKNRRITEVEFDFGAG